MDFLTAIRSCIDKVLSAVCCFLFAAMVVIGTYQIVTRYVFNSPSTVSEELLTYSFTWMALLLSAYVFGKRDHMRVAFLADKLTGKPRQFLLRGKPVVGGRPDVIIRNHSTHLPQHPLTLQLHHLQV